MNRWPYLPRVALLRCALDNARSDVGFWRRKRRSGWSGARQELTRAQRRVAHYRAELSAIGVPTW